MRNPALGGAPCQLGGDKAEHTRTNRDPQPIRAELRCCYRAEAAGIVVDCEKRRRGSPLCALARKLVAAGYDPERPLHVYRGGTLCFKPLPLERWAGLTVEEGDNSERSARFRKYTPPSLHRETPQSAVTQGHFSGLRGFSGASIPEVAE